VHVREILPHDVTFIDMILVDELLAFIVQVTNRMARPQIVRNRSADNNKELAVFLPRLTYPVNRFQRSLFISASTPTSSDSNDVISM